MIHELFFAVFQILVNILQVVILLFVIFKFDLSVGTVVSIFTLLNKAYEPIAIFNVEYVDYKLNKVSIKKYLELLDEKEDERLLKGKKIKNTFKKLDICLTFCVLKWIWRDLMEKLTDDMIMDVIGSNDIAGFVMAIVMVFILLLVGVFFMLAGFRKNKKINQFIVIGLIMIIIDIFLFLICLFALNNDKDWYVTKSVVMGKYKKNEGDSTTRDRVYYYVKLSDNVDLKVSNLEYDDIDKNDLVYVLMVNGQAVEIWNMDNYEYDGDKLK